MRRFSTVRARTTIAATLLFAISLAIGGVGLVSVLRRTMTDNVDTALALRAGDLAALLEAGSTFDEVTIVDDDEAFVQIVQGGTVVASSENVQGELPLADKGSKSASTLGLNPVDDSVFRILVEETDTPSGPVTVIVATTMEDVESTVRVTVGTLAVGMPVLIALAGLITWMVVGRALRPVESIRAEVAEIGATDLHRRVPQPTTADEIGRLATTMNDMLDRIESGTVRQRQFVSDASHELRTPIATIRHQLEVALQHADDSQWPAVAQDVLDEDLRMQRLVDDLLWLARHDQPRDPSDGLLVDLDEVVQNLIRRQKEPDGVIVDGSGIGAGQVRGNPDDLTRVVQNLLDNARRHAATRVVVTVLSAGGGRVQVHVDDDGPGVAVDQRLAIFERFTRSDEARGRDDGGSGLGLAIALEIVKEHGGTLLVTGSPMGGARFTVEFDDARRAASL